MIKILFLINSLGGGGAERVLVNLVNYMDKDKFDITVETMFYDGVNKSHLSSDVKYICKHAPNFKGVSKLIKFIPEKILYKYFIGKEKYDIVVGYMHGAPTKIVAGCTDSGIKKITWLHNGNPKTGTFFRFWTNRETAIKAYKKMDAIVGVSNSVSDAFASYTATEVKTIYNTNDTEKIIEMSNELCQYDFSKEKLTICTAGRIEGNKGYDRLVNVSSKLISEGFDFELIIMGSGEDDEKIKNQVKELGLDNYIKLLGFCENPYNIMKNSDIYILSSRTEGLPTVVVEALTIGLPVVATDVSGVREILGDNSQYGLIVKNSVDGIYGGLKKMLLEPELRDKYRATAKLRAKEFDTEHTVKQAEKFFEDVMSGVV